MKNNCHYFERWTHTPFVYPCRRTWTHLPSCSSPGPLTPAARLSLRSPRAIGAGHFYLDSAMRDPATLPGAFLLQSFLVNSFVQRPAWNCIAPSPPPPPQCHLLLPWNSNGYSVVFTTQAFPPWNSIKTESKTAAATMRLHLKFHLLLCTDALHPPPRAPQSSCTPMTFTAMFCLALIAAGESSIFFLREFLIISIRI